MSMQAECAGEEFRKAAKDKLGDKAEAFLKTLPVFGTAYESWYSEAKAAVRQLLPDRLDDFVRHYEKPKPRKDITSDTYRIEDYLQGISVTKGYYKEKVVGPDAALPHFRQQLAILKAVKNRFESSLFDIRQLEQADLFDSELEAASLLAKNRFGRAAGALAGVVLEKHLAEVASSHSVKIAKKNPTISDFDEALKDANVLDVAQWRFLQHLGDLRNICAHNKQVEPTGEQVLDLLGGVTKVTKTIF